CVVLRPYCRRPAKSTATVASSRDEGSELLQWRHPVDERAHALGYCEDNLDHTLLQRGVLDRPCVHGVVTGIAVQLLDNLARLGVTAPQITRPGPCLAEPRIQQREIGVERLRGRAVRLRLHELRVGG